MTVMVPVGVVQVGCCVTLAVGAAGAVFGAGVTELLAGLTQPPTVCVAVSAVVVVTVRGLPLPPSLQVSVPMTLLAVTVELPQLSNTASVGAPGTGVTVMATELLVAGLPVAQAALEVSATVTASALASVVLVNVLDVAPLTGVPFTVHW